MHACEVHAYAPETHDHETPMEVVYEDLVRQNIVAHLSQLQLEVFDVVAYGFQSSPWRPKTTI
jgi:hypothetical protein